MGHAPNQLDSNRGWQVRPYLVEVDCRLALQVLLRCSGLRKKFLQIVCRIVGLRHCFQCFGKHHEREAENVEKGKLYIYISRAGWLAHSLIT